jgi:hypothetical protein
MQAKAAICKRSDQPTRRLLARNMILGYRSAREPAGDNFTPSRCQSHRDLKISQRFRDTVIEKSHYAVELEA